MPSASPTWPAERERPRNDSRRGSRTPSTHRRSDATRSQSRLTRRSEAASVETRITLAENRQAQFDVERAADPVVQARNVHRFRYPAVFDPDRLVNGVAPEMGTAFVGV